MPVAASDLVMYGSANLPRDDVSTSGGAADTAARPLDTQFAATAVAEVVSDGADTRNVTVIGRDAAGAEVTEVVALNGATPAATTATFERILQVDIASADGARTVTLHEGAAGPTRHTFNPNETKAYIHYQNASSEAAGTSRYEKSFWRNNHATLALTSATVTMTANPSGKIEMGLEAAKDGTQSVADRETAPGSVTFVGVDVAQAVPSDSLGATEAIGVWAHLALLADDAPLRSSFTLEIAGTTT